MPWPDDDLPILHPLRFPGSLLTGTHGSAHCAATQRPVLMKADVGNGVEAPTDVKNADFPPRHVDSLVRPLRHLIQIGHENFAAHRFTPSRSKSRSAFVPRILRRT